MSRYIERGDQHNLATTGTDGGRQWTILIKIIVINIMCILHKAIIRYIPQTFLAKIFNRNI